MSRPLNRSTYSAACRKDTGAAGSSAPLRGRDPQGSEKASQASMSSVTPSIVSLICALAFCEFVTIADVSLVLLSAVKAHRVLEQLPMGCW